LRTSWQASEGLVRSLDLSPDGKLLATAARDGTLSLWDVSTGKVRVELQKGVLGFQVVAFTPDGKSLVTGGINHDIHRWDMAEIMKQRSE
jgi:WD40 repeat protein